jgi:hypothetical protein
MPSVLLTKIFAAVKKRLLKQMYCATMYARSGVIKCGFSKTRKLKITICYSVPVVKLEKTLKYYDDFYNYIHILNTGV